MKTLQQIADEEGVSRQAVWLRTPKGKAYEKAYRKAYRKAYEKGEKYKAYQKTYYLRQKSKSLNK